MVSVWNVFALPCQRFDDISERRQRTVDGLGFLEHRCYMPALRRQDAESASTAVAEEPLQRPYNFEICSTGVIKWAGGWVCFCNAPFCTRPPKGNGAEKHNCQLAVEDSCNKACSATLEPNGHVH